MKCTHSKYISYYRRDYYLGMQVEIYVVLLFLNIVFGGHCFRSDLMHKVCGSTIAGRSGKVIFDAKKLPFGLRSCRISLTLENDENPLNVTSHLMFYFTDFLIQDDCNSGNAIFGMFDGVDKAQPSGKGKALVLCGSSHAAVKTDTLFTSSGGRINVSFSCKDTKKQCSSYFSFIYSSFHTGSCETSKEFECSQGSSGHMCIRKEMVCTHNLNFCGSINDSTCSSTPLQEKSLEYVKYIMCALLGIFVLFGIKFFYRQYRKGRNGDETCFSSIKQICVGKQQECPNDHLSALENFSAVRESLSQAAGNEEGETNAVDTTSADIQFNNVILPDRPAIMPSAPTLEEIECEIPAPLPPAYDESIVPTYKEVMAHQDKYIVH